MSQQEIKSRSHPVVQKLRAVRDGRDKTFIFCEGWRLIEDALRSKWVIQDLVTLEAGQQQAKTLLKDHNQVHAPLVVLSEDTMKFSSDLESPPGVIGLFRKPSTNPGLVKSVNDSLQVVLHQINMPQNLGNLLRTCEAAGVGSVFITKNSSDPFGPKVLRGAMGSVFRVKLVTQVDLSQTVHQLKASGHKVYGAIQSGSIPYHQVDWTKPSALVVGSEASGFSKNELSLFDQTIVIPMEGSVESLNVGTAAAVCLFEAVRQRREIHHGSVR